MTCIAAHPLGSHVACGGKSYSFFMVYVLRAAPGEDGTKIWNLKDSSLLCSPVGASQRGITTAIVWMIRPDDTLEGLAFGTNDGFLCVWKREKTNNVIFQGHPRF